MGGITQGDVLAGVDLLLKVFRYLDEEVRDGEVKDIIDGLFRRSGVVLDIAVVVDQFSDRGGELAFIIITEKHSEIIVIDALFRRARFVLVDDMRSRKDHRSGVNKHDDRCDDDRCLICFYQFEEILIKLHTFLSLISGSRSS